MNWTTLLASGSAALICAVSTGTAAASPQLLSEAKKGNLPAQNCQYCHVSKLPKKDSFKPDDLNDRGRWLTAEKDKQKAKDIKADWLKGFPGGNEQK